MSEKIVIQDGDETIELTGEAKEQFIAYRESLQAEIATAMAEQQAKIDARESALAKLAALGLTEAEIAAL
jgi:DNA-binding NarL/FixJ family response regulator